MDIRKPNVKGKRFRGTFKSLSTAESYNTFLESNPEHKTLSLLDFKKIIKTFNETLVEGVIENRNGVELPEGLGYIFMGTCPPAKAKNINFKQSLELGVVTTHKNWDSDNKLMKIFYSNHHTKYPFRHKQLWVFKAGKEFRKKASDGYKEDWAKYIEVAPKEKISAMFDHYRKKEKNKNLKSVIPEDYNEFNI